MRYLFSSVAVLAIASAALPAAAETTGGHAASPAPEATRSGTAVFVQNLTDDTVQLLKFEQGATIYATRYNQPRTVGINAIYRW